MVLLYRILLAVTVVIKSGILNVFVKNILRGFFLNWGGEKEGHLDL